MRVEVCVCVVEKKRKEIDFFKCSKNYIRKKKYMEKYESSFLKVLSIFFSFFILISRHPFAQFFIFLYTKVFI